MSAATAVRERPILMSAAMVRAVLRDEKTQTRRAINPQPVRDKSNPDEWRTNRRNYSETNHRRIEVRNRKDGSLVRAREFYMPVEQWLLEKSPYRVGDRLWVRETWNVAGLMFGRKPVETRAAAADAWRYAADDETGWQHGWRPSIHMPRWASRITLEITEVRCQRLQDISREDAIAEGIPTEPFAGTLNGEAATIYPIDPVYHFGVYWNSLLGDGDPVRGAKRLGSWASNPWVDAISFRRV